MLDLIKFIDDVDIYSNKTDDWGITSNGGDYVTVKGYVKPVYEFTEMMNQKNKSVIPTYTIGLGGNVDVKAGDVIGLDCDGERRTFTVIRKKPIKDLAGNILYIKVWV